MNKQKEIIQSAEQLLKEINSNGRYTIKNDFSLLAKAAELQMYIHRLKTKREEQKEYWFEYQTETCEQPMVCDIVEYTGQEVDENGDWNQQVLTLGELRQRMKTEEKQNGTYHSRLARHIGWFLEDLKEESR